MKPNLDNIIDALKRYFLQMDRDQCKNIVLTLGNTGSGKSTLLGSINVGPKNLEMKTEVTYRANGAKQRIKYIDYKSDVVNIPFEIGHGVESKTFYPKFVNSKDGYNLVDIAGLNDTHGAMSEFVNQLIIKKLLSVASQARFLIVFTLN